YYVVGLMRSQNGRALPGRARDSVRAPAGSGRSREDAPARRRMSRRPACHPVWRRQAAAAATPCGRRSSLALCALAQVAADDGSWESPRLPLALQPLLIGGAQPLLG